MRQPEPVNADTEDHSYPFPYYRRTRLLKRIADTFVNEGEEAGNWMAQVSTLAPVDKTSGRASNGPGFDHGLGGWIEAVSRQR